MRTGERLREQRDNAGLTLGQVATYEGVTPQYLSNLEKGRNAPNVWPLLARLARRYGCSTDYLLGLTDDPTPAGEVSAIQLLFERLSAARQQDLLEQAAMWLADEDEAYELRWLQERMARYEAEGLADLVDRLLDEEESDSDEAGAS